jgi:hypothetical protein
VQIAVRKLPQALHSVPIVETLLETNEQTVLLYFDIKDQVKNVIY